MSYKLAKLYAIEVLQRLPNADWRNIGESWAPKKSQGRIPYINVEPYNISKAKLDAIGNRLFHFCSVDVCCSIIGKNAIWLNEVSSFKDNEEFINPLINISKANNYNIDITNYRQIFWNYISMTTSENLFSKKMWETHGHSFAGVAIEFEILDYEEIIRPKIFIQQVTYSQQIIEDFIENHNKFISKHPYDFVIDWGCYPAFFKNHEFSFEQEIRIIVESSLDIHPMQNLGKVTKRYTPVSLDNSFLRPIKIHFWSKENYDPSVEEIFERSKISFLND